MDYEHGINMARTMKRTTDEVTEKIREAQKANYGVVALFFSDKGKTVRIEVLDEPFGSDVRVYPGE